MDVTQIYTIIAGGIFGVLVVIQWILRVLETIQTVSLWGFCHLVYPFILRRHRFVGPWTRSGLLVRLLYLLANAFCGSFRVNSLAQARKRTGTLSLINMIPLYFGAHLSFVADLLGVSLGNLCSIHGSSAAVSTFLGSLHVIFGYVSSAKFRVWSGSPLYGFIVCITS